MTALDGKVVLLTGATDGMGRALAASLAREGATVLVHGRDEGRIAATVAEVTEAAGHPDRVRSYQADLASLAAVRALAGQVTRAERRLDVLVNNAGIGVSEPGGGARQESADGIELRFAVNYLAGYALSRHLLPLLTRSAPSRIVNVASVGQQAVDFGDVMLTRDYDGMRAYRQSKLAQVMDTFDLAGELEAAGVTVNALHPATFMPTKVSPAPPASTIADGVEATLRLITAPPERTGTGRYFTAWTSPALTTRPTTRGPAPSSAPCPQAWPACNRRVPSRGERRALCGSGASVIMTRCRSAVGVRRAVPRVRNAAHSGARVDHWCHTRPCVSI